MVVFSPLYVTNYIKTSLSRPHEHTTYTAGDADCAVPRHLHTSPVMVAHPVRSWTSPRSRSDTLPLISDVM